MKIRINIVKKYLIWNGYTPLICASQNGHLEVVKYLIDKGANIESKDNSNFKYLFWNGYTPLMHASKNIHLEVVEYLIDKGANIEIKTNDNFKNIF